MRARVTFHSSHWFLSRKSLTKKCLDCHSLTLHYSALVTFSWFKTVFSKTKHRVLSIAGFNQNVSSRIISPAVVTLNTRKKRHTCITRAVHVHYTCSTHALHGPVAVQGALSAGGGGGVPVLGRGAPHADAVVIRGRDQDLKISSSHKRSLIVLIICFQR